jgi:GntR family transcriptional regulator
MKLVLSQSSGVPFWRQLHDQLADRIRAGALLPGEALPSVRQLAVDALVSVITVKKAYDELEAAGLVVSHQGRGTFVAESGVAASRAALMAELVAELGAVVDRARAAGIAEAEIAEILATAQAGRSRPSPGAARHSLPKGEG